MISKRYFLLIVFIATIFSMVNISFSLDLKAYDLSDPKEMATAYFNALKQGDLESIGSLLSGDLQREKSEHLKQTNYHYAEFLKKYYDGAQLTNITMKELSSEKMECNLNFTQGVNRTTLILILFRTDGFWKIAGEK
jgi:hypothetical protein